MKGRKHTKESREKISKALKGRIPKNLEFLHRMPKTEEWNKNIGLSNIGRKVSLETRAKQSEAHKGSKCIFWKGGISVGENRKEYKRIKARERRVLKMNCSGSHSLEEWRGLKKKHNFKCVCCKKKEPEIKLTEDHITALSKGGSDNIENIQPLCQSCNSRKINKYIKYMEFEIFMDEFKAPLSDIIDKEKFEAFPVDGVTNGWMIRKKEEEKTN